MTITFHHSGNRSNKDTLTKFLLHQNFYLNLFKLNYLHYYHLKSVNTLSSNMRHTFTGKKKVYVHSAVAYPAKQLAPSQPSGTIDMTLADSILVLEWARTGKEKQTFV